MSKKEARIIVYHQVTSSGVSGSNHILTATFDKDHKVSIAVDAFWQFLLHMHIVITKECYLF